MWSRHSFSHLGVISRLLNRRADGFVYVDVELDKTEKAAVQALLDERNALEADRNRIQALLDQEQQKARFRSSEAPWHSYDRLRNIADKKLAE